MPDLCTLAQAKEWLNQTTDTDDAMISRMIASQSDNALAFLGRASLASQEYSEAYSGVGMNRIMLRQWPVTAVSAVSINGVSIAAQATPPLGTGFFFQPWNQLLPGAPAILGSVGYPFAVGTQNISVTYTAGYRTFDEAATVPAASAYTVTPRYTWLADLGVTLVSSGLPMTAVSSNPAAGQYSVSSVGVYTFNSAQASAAVLLNYSFVPPVVNNAVIELVALRYRERSRIGINSVGDGQTSTSYVRAAMTEAIRDALSRYQMVVPV